MSITEDTIENRIKIVKSIGLDFYYRKYLIMFQF